MNPADMQNGPGPSGRVVCSGAGPGPAVPSTDTWNPRHSEPKRTWSHHSTSGMQKGAASPNDLPVRDDGRGTHLCLHSGAPAPAASYCRAAGSHRRLPGGPLQGPIGEQGDDLRAVENTGETRQPFSNLDVGLNGLSLALVMLRPKAERQASDEVVKDVEAVRLRRTRQRREDHRPALANFVRSPSLEPLLPGYADSPASACGEPQGAAFCSICASCWVR